MSTVYITNKGKLKDTLQKYYIFYETEMGNQINSSLGLPQRDTKLSPDGMKTLPASVRPEA
jgi:hypothetical protein